MVYSHMKAGRWQLRIADSRVEAVRIIDDYRQGRDLDPDCKRRIAAFLDGRPDADWLGGGGSLVSHSTMGAMSPAFEVWGHIYRPESPIALQG